MKNLFSLFVIVFLITFSQFSFSQKADFTADVTKGCKFLSVKFKDKSTGASSWLWELGNGNTSVEQNPQVNYTKPGKYTISLSINNGKDKIEKKEFIIVYGIDVSFAIDNYQGCAPLNVKYTDKTTTNHGQITSWVWNFGDGNMAEIQNPVHTYKKGGKYKVLLTVEVDNLCKESFYLEDKTVNVSGNYKPYFKAENINCDFPREVEFQNSLTLDGKSVAWNSMDSYSWDFGDGNKSSESNPTHKYTKEGAYNVEVEVEKDGCKYKYASTGAVNIKKYEIDFSADKTKICTGDEVTFTAKVPDGANSTKWKFTENGYSTYRTTNTYYTAGDQTVTLISTMDDGCVKELTKKAFIKVNQSPQVNFTCHPSQAGGIPVSVKFTNLTSYADSFVWDFGDGTTEETKGGNIVHEYKKFGSYDVKVEASNANCSDAFRMDDLVNIIEPKITIVPDTTSGCFPLDVNFTTTSSSVDPIVEMNWDFGDGNTANGKAVKNTYNKHGKFDVKVIAKTSRGYTFETIVENLIQCGDSLALDYKISQNSYSVSDYIDFDCETKEVDSLFLIVKDSRLSSVYPDNKAPFHHEFLPPREMGEFIINVLAYDNGCPSYDKKDASNCQGCGPDENGNKIKVDLPILDLEFNQTSFCSLPAELEIVDKSLGVDEVFIDFGDGNTSNKNVTKHSYTKTGDFKLLYVAKNNTTGLGDTIRKTIHVHVTHPGFMADTLSGCYPLTVNFSDTSKTTGSIISRQWMVNGKTEVFTRNFTYTFETPADYEIELKVMERNGCVEKEIKTEAVDIFGPIVSIDISNDTLCANREIEIKNTTESKNPIQEWNWLVDSESYKTKDISLVSYSSNSVPLSLTAIDDMGCIGKLDTVITFVDLWAYFYTNSKSCTNSEMQFNSYGYGHNLCYKWDFGDGATSDVQFPKHTYKEDGTYKVRLYATDKFGCVDSSSTYNIKTTSPDVDFTASITDLGCASQAEPIQLIPECSADVVEWEWQFGDSTSSTYESPVKKYPPGSHTVSLTGKSISGCKKTITKEDYIKADGPVGKFKLEGERGCVPLTVDFIAEPSNIQSVSWDFGDGTALDTSLTTSHTYNYEGRFLPYVLLVDLNGCAFTYDAPEIIAATELIANDDEYITDEDFAIDMNILDNDSLVMDLFSGIEIISEPLNGVAELTNRNSIYYSPKPNFYGIDSLKYTVFYDVGYIDTAFVKIYVTNTPDNPVVSNKTIYARDIEDLIVDVKSEVSDIDNNLDISSIKITSQPSSGEITITDDGIIEYIPTYNNNSIVQYTYSVCDSTQLCCSSTVIMNLRGLIYPPMAVDDRINVNEDTSTDVFVKKNDYDAVTSSDFLIVEIAEQPQNGKAVEFDGVINYTPNKNYCDNDTIKYRITNTSGKSSEAFVFITIESDNDPIEAPDIEVVFAQGVADIILPGFFDPDFTEQPKITDFEIVYHPNHGTITNTDNITGELIYEPQKEFVGRDNIKYRVCDEDEFCDEGTITVIVEPNKVPIAKNDQFNAEEDIVLSLPIDTFLRNVTDEKLDFETLKFKNISSGEMSVNLEDSTVNYKPQKNSNDKVNIHYEICDIFNQCVTSELEIDIKPIDDAPEVVDVTPLDVALGGISNINILERFIDPEDNMEPSTLEIVEQPYSGFAITLENGNLEFDYTEIFESEENEVITVKVCDETNLCTEYTFTINYETYNDLIDIKKAFSPNNDGTNDLLHIKNIEYFPNNEIIVYNRWGNEVYRKDAYQNDWDGKSSSGKVLPDGTYFYLFYAVKGKTPVKGYIYIKSN